MIESHPVNERVVALTFDDGPTSDLTARLLDTLKGEGIKATLYVIGGRVVKNPELVKRAQAEGHEIGNHTWTHKNLTEISREEALEQIQLATDAIVQAIGHKPATFRPPFIATNEALNLWIRDELGMKVISASVDSLDWRDKNAETAFQNVTTKVAPGGIILCHETQPTTLEALPKIIRELKAKGYRFVTVSELLALSPGS